MHHLGTFMLKYVIDVVSSLQKLDQPWGEYLP
jgi:hypothetical protein